MKPLWLLLTVLTYLAGMLFMAALLGLDWLLLGGAFEAEKPGVSHWLSTGAGLLVLGGCLHILRMALPRLRVPGWRRG
ncbi:hypothetical protein [Metapseudomonas resinovorans]|nr:hypothetical protein [Pseudomonas resinovorans]